MKVIAFGDTHFPFENTQKMKKVYSIIEKEKPDCVIHLGDLYDNYMFSRFDKDFNVIKPKDELSLANTKGIQMWYKICKIAPKAERIQLMGNHCIRVTKMILRYLPSLYSEAPDIKKKYYSFDGVEVMRSDREYVERDGVVYCHGWHNSCTAHMNHFKKPVVHGHRHTPDLWHMALTKNDYKPRWEMDCGTLCDKTKVPFEYTNSALNSWLPAVGVITNGKPELILI